MTEAFTLQDWIGEILLAIYELTLIQFRQDHFRVCRASDSQGCSDPIGGYIPVISDHEAFMIGIFTDKGSSRELTKYFIQAESADNLKPDDVADILREILNILCGMLKRRLVARYPVLKTGFPVISEGIISTFDEKERVCVRVEIGNADLYMMIIRTRAAATPDPAQENLGRIDLADWLDAMMTATLQVVPLTMGKVQDLHIDSLVNQYGNTELYSAYIPLIGHNDAVLIGLLSNHKGLKEIVGAFWGESAQGVTLAEAADAGKETLNILAGMIRRQLSERNLRFRMGIPIFMEGYVEVSEEEEAVCAWIQVNEAKVHLVMIRKKSKVVLRELKNN